MKSLAIFVLCVLACFASAELSAERKEEMKQRGEVCKAETGAQDDLISKVNAGEPVDDTPELIVKSINYQKKKIKTFSI